MVNIKILTSKVSEIAPNTKVISVKKTNIPLNLCSGFSDFIDTTAKIIPVDKITAKQK